MPKNNRLVQERETSRLEINKLIQFLEGGVGPYKLRQRAEEIIKKNPGLIESDYISYDLTRAEKREKTLQKIILFKKIGEEIQDPELIMTLFDLISKADTSFSVRYGIHMGLFVGALTGQGTEEQKAFYVPKAEKFEIYGCFCMTELGTGSYLQSIETTSTYLPESDEFLINSPTITSTKWWIGGAAQTANYAIVFAKLIIDEKDLGTHNFIVQLRDNNFDVCPGVSIGDCGPKRGLNGIDNGWVRFDNVRIPRTQMLMKWSQVTSEGVYVKSEFPQLAYGALIGGRVSIARSITTSVKKAVTIASRYSIVRDQFTMKGKCLLDYTTQQERVIGALCSAYAFHFATERLAIENEMVIEELLQKDTRNLKDLHNKSAGLKGFGALWANGAINDCILCLGGHSYSNLSGLPKILNDFAPSIPYEGDAILLVQQTASYLVKSVAAMLQGKELQGSSIQYLKNIVNLDAMKSSVDSSKELSLKEMKEAAQWLSLALIRDSAMDLQNEIMERGSQEEAWNAGQLKLIQASKAHILYSIIENFMNVIENQLPNALGENAAATIRVMTQVAELFALRHIQEFMHVFYEYNYFPISRGNLIRKQIANLYVSIRPNVVRLVDAWNISDDTLATPLARFDGEIYENYFKAVNDISQDVKPDYWKEYLKQYFDQSLIKAV
jgi:acyl-CoA oxidase